MAFIVRCKAFVFAALTLSSLTASPILQANPNHPPRIQQDAMDLDLELAVNLALVHDQAWLSFQKRTLAQQENAIQARAELLPSVYLFGNTSKVDSESGASGDFEGNQHGFSASINQPLYNLERWFQYRASQASNRQLDAQLKASYQAMIIKTTTAYLDALRANAELEFAQAELTAIKQQLNEALQRFKVGRLSEMDVHQAQAAHDLAEVNYIAATSDKDIADENLTRLVDIRFHRVKQIRDNFPVEPTQPSSISNWVALALKTNPSIAAARQGELAAKRTVYQAKARFSPTLELVATYSDTNSSDTSFNSIDSKRTQLGLEFSWPVFQGMKTASQHRQAKLAYSSAQDDLNNEFKNSIQVTRNLFRSIQTDVLRVKAQNQSIKSSKSALVATQAGYQVGKRNVADVLVAQRGLFAAQRDYSNARYDYILHTLQLKQAAGTLKAKDITDLNTWLL